MLFSPDAREKPCLVLLNERSFGKAAGKWITDKAQTIRFKLKNNLILGIKKRINSKAYPLYL